MSAPAPGSIYAYVAAAHCNSTDSAFYLGTWAEEAME